MNGLQLAHTSELDAGTLRAARSLLDGVFGDEMTDADWEHALGGLHAIVREDGELVAHASLVQRRLLHRGRALRTGYVEAVAVRADLRGRGLGAAVMLPLERAIRAAYDLGALGSSDEGLRFYEARGWRRWEGPTSALTPTGTVRTPDEDGSIFVLPAAAELDLTAELTCDWRDGDVW